MTIEQMAENAERAAGYLKSLSHSGRLMTLCHLGSGEKSVSELEELLELRQAAVSQILARLRDENLVVSRREGKSVFYSLSDTKTMEMMELLYRHFCVPTD